MNPYGFMPHGFCFEWRPGVLWLHVASDLTIACAYFGISLLLLYLVVKRRRELSFKLLFVLFSTFITLCGTTHLLGIWVLWHPDYFIEGGVKAATAIVSVTTLFTLLYALPRALQAALSLETLVATRGKELADANAQLRAQIAARETIESTLRQSQKMEAIGQLTGGIAHDFNNMLQAIGSSIEMAKLDVAAGHAEQAQTHVGRAQQMVERASALTSQLLSYARRQPLQPRPVRLDELIVSMDELLRRTLNCASAAITIEMRLNDGGWPVLCDPNQLENALLNIVLNARDAMPDGGRLVISTRQTRFNEAGLAGHQDAEPGDYIEVVIADSGTGMDQATRQRAFEPFFTTKPIGQGTGLGLSQVYGFARQSGGLVMLESSTGGGTEVHVCLRRAPPAVVAAPAQVALAAPAQAAAPAAPNTGTCAGNGRLLLVEDELIVREITAEYLRKRGYDVLEAEDAPTALELFYRSAALDLLITDVGLPNGMNGRQLADNIRETSPALPVLFITGYAGTARLDQLGAGMHVLAKPFRLPALAAQVAAMLGAGVGRHAAGAPGHVADAIDAD